MDPHARCPCSGARQDDNLVFDDDDDATPCSAARSVHREGTNLHVRDFSARLFLTRHRVLARLGSARFGRHACVCVRVCVRVYMCVCI